MKTRDRRLALVTGAVAFVVLAIAAWLSWPHLRFWWLFEPLGLNAQGYPEYRHRKTGIVFVSLPGGKFFMGAQKTDPNAPNYDPQTRDEEGPVHEVTLSAFMIAKFETSQQQWRSVMGTDPSTFKDAGLPVEGISWQDCQDFCRKAGLKLPTEAQWEYACRAATHTPYGGTGKLEEMAWLKENSGGRTHPVGQKQANGFGLHDMHGNAIEWCEDVYNFDFYARPEAVGLDPVCTARAVARVLRSQAFFNPRGFARSAIRCRFYPTYRSQGTGLRAAASPPP